MYPNLNVRDLEANHRQEISDMNEAKCRAKRNIRICAVILVILTVIIAIIGWQTDVNDKEKAELETHDRNAMERVIEDTTLVCGRLFQIGYSYDTEIILTRNLTFDCPINHCNCDSYAEEWIIRQPLYTVYFTDTHPTDWDRSYPHHRDSQITGLAIGLGLCIAFWLITALTLYYESRDLRKVNEQLPNLT